MVSSMEYTCKKCGCKKVYAKPSGRRMGVYCSECNEWITWTTYANMQSIYKEISEDPTSLNDSVSPRRIKKYGGSTKMSCSKCGCLLFNSIFPKVKGQFDLVNASYCPNCGRTLI